MSDFEQAFCAAASGDRVFVTRFTSTLGISDWDFLVRAYDARNQHGNEDEDDPAATTTSARRP